ncbi:TraB/GumN family protein [uncultured Desulfovibrio sp.]|uniref:TraB/GumN family protein n=1 Tax=uncultured Desulfovibrio sp. TaxID=167968 RepID=UPI0026080197|nr:TraB/GumN family protein [uncultured Desulfovibrio sp.]
MPQPPVTTAPDCVSSVAGPSDFPARIPEHSPALMAVASGGRPLRVGDYLFFHSGDQLIGIGYALTGGSSPAAFAAAFREARRQTGAVRFHLMAPRLPAEWRAHVTETDRYYVLPTQAQVPSRLRAPVARARAALRLEAGREFTPAHRRLWGEFLGRAALPPSVRALYGRVEDLLRDPSCRVSLLNAFDGGGHLAACLLMDEAPAHFDAYLLGAHSREYYTPHAADALFALMLERARQRGKRFLHLGLGVNEGIARFKRKWGGRPALRYVRADWEERQGGEAFMEALLAGLRADPDAAWREAQREMEHAQVQRPFRMLWKVEKNGRTSWIGGTSHFFSKSFEQSFKKLYRHIDTVLFEGHLDDASLEKVSLAGKTPPEPSECLYNLLTEEERHNLERIVRGPEGFWARLLNIEAPNKADVGWYLRRTRHWYAFFALWCAYLERSGWKYSVDLEAWRIAQAEGKRILAMEDIEEQIDALRAVPVQRAVNFLKDCNNWPKYRKANEKAYLAGDLLGLSGTTTEFPTRTGHIIGKRDQRFRERMLPYLEAGNALALVGSAHLLNLRSMLEEDGFAVTACNRGFFSKIKV